jgi:hypothetical protein
MSPPPAWPRVPDTARPDGGHSGSSGRSIRRSLRLVTTSSTLLKADPAGGRRPPSGPVATRRSPGHRPHRPAQPAPTPHPDRHVVLTRFRACQRERPRPLQAAATGPWWGLGCVSQRTSASTRTALAAAALAEPLGEALPDGRAGLLGDLQQEGPQRLAQDLQEASREQPPQGSSPHAGAETDQRYRLQCGTGGTKKRPAGARRSASVALFGHTPTTTAQLCQ